jgi:hypothetical protein
MPVARRPSVDQRPHSIEIERCRRRRHICQPLDFLAKPLAVGS